MLAQSPPTSSKFPPAASPEPDRRSSTSARASTARCVLVVDDEPLVRWAVAETLRRRGYQIAEAGDAGETLRALAGPDLPPDIVILDLRLPDCADLRLLARIRSLIPSMPVIVMTAFGTPELRDEARHLGACAILDKPFDLDVLDGLVARVSPAAR